MKHGKERKSGEKRGGPGRPGVFAALRLNLRMLAAVVLAAALGLGAIFTVSAVTAEEAVRVPVVMYHAVLKDPAQRGKYVVSPSEFENDLLYLKKNGYTTILVQDLIDYAKHGGQLPEKPVLLTFDDGYYNNYLYAFSIAKKYGSKFVISPIIRWTEHYSETGEVSAYYTHATWEQLREMSGSGLVEIQNHSYDLHQSQGGRVGAGKRQGESEEEYRALLTADLGRAQEAIEARLGIRPTAFVYPFGAISRESPEIVRAMGFEATMTCREKVNEIRRDEESLYGLGRFLRPSGISSEEFFQKLEKAGS